MNNNDKTHWKKLTNPDYIGAYSMPSDGTDVVLTISEVKKQTVVGAGGRKELCTIAHFKENSKPMILNRTNCKVITAIYKTPYVEEWAGKKIQIYVDHNIEVKGEIIEGLRIRPFEPQKNKPELDINSPAFNNCKQHIVGGGKIEDIENKYSLTEQAKQTLCSLVKKD